MSLIVYLPKKDRAGQRLLRTITNMEYKGSMELIFTIHGLDQRLKLPTVNREIVLLMISTIRDLDELMALRDLIISKRVVMIVPNMEKETISKGHLFHPRFLSDRDSDFLDVAQVLKKMLLMASPKPHEDQNEVLTQRGGV